MNIMFKNHKMQEARAFSGYIAGKGSKPCGSMTGATKTLEEVRSEQSYGAKMADGMVCIHFNEKSYFQYFMAIIAQEKMRALIMNFNDENGTYIIFHKPQAKFKAGTHTAAIGLPIQVFIGSTYIPLKVNGSEAEILTPATDDNIPQLYNDVPPAFYETDLQQNFCEMDGTDEQTIESLDGYKTALYKNKKLTEKACKSILHAINQYVLKTPLPDDEYKKLVDFSNMRSNGAEFEINGKFSHDVCADYMIDKYNACNIDGSLYLYNGFVYRCDYDEVMRQIDLAYPPSTAKQRDEVYKKMKLRAPVAQKADPAIIAFNNGLIDLRKPAGERELIPFNPDIHVTHRLAVDYMDGQYTGTKEYEFLESVLDSLSCGDDGIKKMLIGCAAYCMYPANPLRSYFVMVGERRSGKSTMLALIESMLGADECSFLNFNDLFTRFGPATLCGKLANLGDEIPDVTLNANQVTELKNLTGAYTPISAELKGKDFFSFVPVAKFIFSCTSIPRMHDPDGSCLNRLIPIPMNACFDENDTKTDATMYRKLQDPKVARVFGAMCIEALDEMKITTKDARFPLCDSAQSKKDDYSLDSDSLRAYINNCGLDANFFYGKTVHEAYMEYAQYSHDAGIKGYPERTFQRQLFRMFDICTIQKRFGTERRRVIVPKSSITPTDTGVQY